MKKNIIILSLLVFSSFATSAPIKFNFTFLEDGGTGKTVGYITYEETLLSNPGNNNFNIPNAAILDLYVEVTGTAGGNGVFTLDDFTFTIFSTGGLPLDFSRELVGQPTDTSPWGTIVGIGKTLYQTQGRGGNDFNLFANNGSQTKTNVDTLKGDTPPPNGVSPFVLQAASGERMAIASFSSHIAIIPTLNQYALIAFAILLLWISFYRFNAKRQD